MAQLEAKLLDGGVAGYCSSSEGEEDDSGWQVAKDDDEHQANVMRRMGPSGQTGAKGVLSEFASFRDQVKTEREMRDRAIMKQAQKGMMQSSKEEREQVQVEDEDDDDDDSLENMRARRLNEMRKAMRGLVVEVTEKEQFSQVIDACTDYLLGVLIYEPGKEDCDKLTHMLKVLAAEYPASKFIRTRSTLLGTSKTFTDHALPTLQFYFRSALVGNFVKMTSVLGEDYSIVQLKDFLRRSHIFLDRNDYDPAANLDDDSDFED